MNDRNYDGEVPMTGRGSGGVVDSSMCFKRELPVNRRIGRYLEHWEQEGTLSFVTCRLYDSLPQSKLRQLSEMRGEWLASHPMPWSDAVYAEYEEEILAKVDRWLDAGVGECFLEDPAVRAVVIDALKYNDGKRYSLYDYVVMPNHVHVVLLAMPGESVGEIIYTIKNYTARQINKMLCRQGQLWQTDAFDHLIRNVSEYQRISDYIRHNPDSLR